MIMKHLLALIVPLCLLIATACNNANSSNGGITGSNAAAENKAAIHYDESASIDDMVKSVMRYAEKEIPAASSIAGLVPVLQERRKLALKCVNDMFEEAQAAGPDNAEKASRNVRLADIQREVFDRVDAAYIKLIENEGASLAHNSIPVVFDTKYFTSGKARLGDVGETTAAVYVKMRAKEKVKGYYRVYVKYLDGSGKELLKEEVMSAQIRQSGDSVYCNFDHLPDVDALTHAKKLYVGVNTQEASSASDDPYAF